MNKKAYGFTIVELLIVIVIIGILAAISIVAYNGVRQRANNAAIINAVSQTSKAIQAYIVATDSYPYTHATHSEACLTVKSGCRNVRKSSPDIPERPSLSQNVQTVASLPSSIPSTGDLFTGITYYYNANTRVDTVSRPVFLEYYLEGTGQGCGISGTLRWESSDTYRTVDAENFTVRDYESSGKTQCRVTISGPAHS